ncbi:zinc ABC transporter substrate-binding protein AztC [Nocardiopsis kunsanensis]|uniref:ABC transporter substrate-binding protein n=1 Tax=Nocardiopsis kunsanensis TaxID=141693 RepID=A0A918XJQ2_9ACTN|nr:zinc ABC transporter substrate-binding protein AztC [Nocardiopsis kunsanensis]GHD33905.1 ABC transporter substrate-binding protein [Nocardiopsis kunsanensis]
MPTPAHRRSSAAALALVFALSGCTADGDAQEHVVVTTNILGDVTENVLGGRAEVTVLMPPGADPHSFEISAQEAALLESASLIVHNGLGLEEGVGHHVTAAEEAGVPTLEVGAHVDPLDYTSDEDEGRPDPHFWTDPQRMITAVDLIAEAGAEEIDGADNARAEAEGYREQVEELDTWMAERFETLPEERRALVTNHHVFGYLAERYGFEVIGAVVPSGTTLASPSSSDLADLAEAVDRAGVEAVFVDSSQPDRLARAMAEEAGTEVEVVSLFSESLTPPGGGAETYSEMMRANTDAIVDALAEDQG